MKKKIRFVLLLLVAILACTGMTTQATAAKRKTKGKTKQITTTTKKKKTTSSEKDKMDKLLEKAKNNPDEITDEEAELLGALFLAGMFNEYSETEKREANYNPIVQSFYANGVRFDIVEVRGGTFRMGTTSEQGSDAFIGENPVHSVTLDSYYIGKTEVTQSLWKAVMGSNPSYYKGDNLPVEQVSWEDCQTFIKKLNALTGKKFRLPTEAEWEFACRGGNNSRGYKYSGSNDIKSVAWYDANSDGQTHPVGSKAPNELGIYDMSGNVWEWCADWYGSYSSYPQTNPPGPISGSYRVRRGGSRFNNARFSRSSCRHYSYPAFRYFILGLRLAL